MAVIGVISLGCDKNRVDTENIMTACLERGHTFTGATEEAEAIIVNTCAFLESAREEAVDAILEASVYKKQGKCRCLIVAGCLAMHYAEEVREALPEVDLWWTPSDYAASGEIICAFMNESNCQCTVPSRRLTTPEHYAYLKIADGCDNRCTYCMIPSIRGHYVSVPRQKLLDEARALVTGGVKELILVAQDTTRYGSDSPKEGTLATLVHNLAQIDGLEIIRLLYCYPECMTDELIETIATEPKVVKYLDIPLQHVSDNVLKRMNRRSTRDSIESLLRRLRARMPGITVRSTFMVGFPGETEKDVEELCDFLSAHQLDNVGFFAYSKEEETPSFRLDGHVDEDTKQRRLERVAAVQQKIAFELARNKIGRRIFVRYEDIDYERNLFIGRSINSAPDIDPVVYFSAKSVEIGQVYEVKIVATDGYDLIAKRG